MPTCPTCRAEVPAASRFCPACGAALRGTDDDATIASDPFGADEPTIATGSGGADLSSPTSPASPGSPGYRFDPGTILAQRYRIVGLLGRGGMGEVYRADDLQLGQPVALKFLDPALAHDPARLERFRNEVRTARTVTHANVCRVHDIGEVEGQPFLSMEFVDGEDLKSLLLRIGHLPQERAVEVARQICAGLAAAHEQGILHRDLKPANVMLDGRGRVRLTDFGLASLAGGVDAADVRAGTPAYQAPEQLRGEAVTEKSDLYALGLVLYELFTGKRVHEADTLAQLHDLHQSSTPSRLSTHVPELDPAVERAVMRCLEKDPTDRPASAIAVSAALPGGDPLAAALAAGETPSPALMAQVGERAGMAPWKAFALAALAMLLVIGATRWAGSMSLVEYLPLEKRPEVLVDRARGMLAELGYTDAVYADPVDRAWGFFVWSEIIGEVAEADSSASRWDQLRRRHDAGSFWYRQSPWLLLPNPDSPPIFTRGQVSITNPPQAGFGEASVLLGLDGSLRRLEVQPRRFSRADAVLTEPDWQRLFALAGLDPARFTEDRPRYQRYLAPDRRRAWVGTAADHPEVELRVEAGSFEGRPVLFNVATTRSLETALGGDAQPVRPGLFEQIGDSSQPVVILAVIFLTIVMSRRNIRLGRADTRGAVRFAGLTFGLFLVGAALNSHALFSHQWASEIWPILVGATFLGVVGWGSYLAAEPLGRRVWPRMFVSSSRLLSRDRIHWRDPLIGQSVLVGVTAGALAFTLVGPVRRTVLAALATAPPRLLGIDTSMLEGQRAALANFLDLSLLLAMAVVQVLALVVIQALVRRRKLALGLTLVIWTLVGGVYSWDAAATGLVAAAIGLAVLLRYGVVAFVVCRLVQALCWSARAGDWNAWYAEGALLGIALLAALVAYGWWAATGGERQGARPA